MPKLESIEFVMWPNIRLRCENGIEFDGFMNDRNRFKLDQMIGFPELEIEDCNSEHGVLRSGKIEVFVSLQRRC